MKNSELAMRALCYIANKEIDPAQLTFNHDAKVDAYILKYKIDKAKALKRERNRRYHQRRKAARRTE